MVDSNARGICQRDLVAVYTRDTINFDDFFLGPLVGLEKSEKKEVRNYGLFGT